MKGGNEDENILSKLTPPPTQYSHGEEFVALLYSQKSIPTSLRRQSFLTGLEDRKSSRPQALTSASRACLLLSFLSAGLLSLLDDVTRMADPAQLCLIL